MDKYDLRDLLDYANRHNLSNKPFIEVYNIWQSEINKAYNEN